MMRRFGWHDGRALAWAITAAGLAQFLWLMFSCARAGLALRLPLPRLTPGVRRTLAIMGPGRDRRRGHPGQSVDLDRACLVPAERLGLLSLLRRPAEPAAAWASSASPSAPRSCRPLSRQLRLGDLRAAVATQNRGLELALLLTLPAAVALAVLADADPRGAVPARRVRPGRYRGDRGGARRLCRRAAGLCPGQGAGARLFRPPRHRDPGQGRGRGDGGQSRPDSRS